MNHPSPGETTDLLYTMVLKLRGVSGSSCPLLVKNWACCVLLSSHCLLPAWRCDVKIETSRCNRDTGGRV